MKAQGVDAKARAQMLGHSKVAPTEDVYTDVLEPELRAAADAMGKLLGPPAKADAVTTLQRPKAVAI